MNPLVSIVIPVYNGSNYMREAIDSALAQTYQNIEIIVVNDGSTDDTREIALSYGDKIRYFEKENGGVSTALNLAIRKMKGEYFSWLSHDDVYYPDKVQAEIDALRESGNMEQAVYSGWDALVMPERTTIPVSIFVGRKYLEIGLLAPVMGFISGCSLLIPKDYFVRYGLFDESLRAVQDYAKWFQMFRDKRLLYVEKSLIKSRVHSQQVTRTYSKMHGEEEELYKWILESISENEIISVGINPYLLWGAVLTRMKRGNLKNGYELALRKLRDLKEPVDGENKRKRFIEYLNDITNEGIYLYCAGSRGESLNLALQLRGVKVFGISDKDYKKWGKKIGDVLCVPPDRVPQNALVIVTKFCPNDVIGILKNKGYKHVISYDFLMDYIFETPIDKMRITS